MTPQAPIRVLATSVIARIAAGEVIARPRAAVRELLDNALDAGATRIEINIESGGYDLIAVHDDGTGIPASDAPLLFTRHATSKLQTPEELTAVQTLGFCGEALASLATVATVTVRTRHRQDAIGVRATSDRDRAIISPLVRTPGTSVEVHRLFSTYPVRRAAAEPAAEARAIRRLVTRYALVHPHIAVTLRIDGRHAVSSTGGTLRRVFIEVFSTDAATHLLDFDCLVAPSARIHGAVGGPAFHRNNRDGIILAVNGRQCDAPDIRAGIEHAYRDVLPRQRFPFAVLHVEIPFNQVDVNIHPAKEYVAIHSGREIASVLERELRALLGKTTHLVTAKHPLALEAAQLPGGRMRERDETYFTGQWGTQIIETGSLPELRLVGQINDTLLVCESTLGTLLIDQHRAHERVIFEKLRSQQSIRLDTPVLCTVPARTWPMFDAHRADFLASGWQWADDEADQIRIVACPDGLTPDDLIPIVERVARETGHSVLAAAACHAAIRKRRPLTPEAAQDLLTQLTRTTTPTTCPHGQPIVINLSHAFLEQQFEWR